MSSTEKVIDFNFGAIHMSFFRHKLHTYLVNKLVQITHNIVLLISGEN